MATIAEQLAHASKGTRVELPAEVRRVASDLILDVAGLCVAARGTDYIAAVLQSAENGGACTAIGHAGSFAAADAALINGIAAHGEDYDDTFEGGPVHAGAVIVPAVLAAAERYGAAPDAILRGIVLGTELMCRLGLVAPMRVHKAGFHPTSVFGAMGSALAVAVTLGLDERQIVDALGIVGSMAGGIIEYLAEGAWTKRLHAAGPHSPAFARRCWRGADSSARARCSKARTASSSVSRTRTAAISRRSRTASHGVADGNGRIQALRVRHDDPPLHRLCRAASRARRACG